MIPKHLRKALREPQELTGEDRSSLLTRLVERGLAEAKMDIAVDRYINERTSLEQSSAIAGVSLRQFIDELTQRNVESEYSMADAESEFEKLGARND